MNAINNEFLKLPWKQHKFLKTYANVRDNEDSCVADCGSRCNQKAQARAAFIVKAANSHANLVSALEDVELRITQARLASTIGKKTGKLEFLQNELNRIGKMAREAIDVLGNEKQNTA